MEIGIYPKVQEGNWDESDHWASQISNDKEIPRMKLIRKTCLVNCVVYSCQYSSLGLGP